MKKLISLFLLLIVLLLNSCSFFGDEYIYIGYANSLDYTFGNLGVDTMYGVQFAVDEINSAGGIKGKQVKLIIRGDDRDKDNAVIIDNQLKDLGVVAIIGHGYSITAESIAQNATDNGILIVSPTISTSEVTGIDDNFFRITPSALEQGYSIANAMHINSPGDVVICYESINEAFSLDFVNSFIEKYEQLGHQVSSENILTFEVSESLDYAFIASQIEEKNIANVLAVGSAFDVGNILQVIDDVENYNFYLPGWTTTSDLMNIASKNANNAISVTLYDFQSNNYKYLTLKQKYKEEFGLNISYASLSGYETMYLLKNALESTDDWSASGLKQALLSETTYTGIMDNYRLDKYGDAYRRLYHFKIVNGEFVTIGSDNYA